MKLTVKNVLLAAGIPAATLALLMASCASSPKNVTIQELIREGRFDEAKQLFATQDVNETDSEGNTALHIAAQMDESDLVNFLIIKGADQQIKNKFGDTPLHAAVKNNAVHSGATLTLYRANIFEKDASGNTPLEISLSKGDEWYNIMINHQTGKLRDINGESIVHYFVRTRNEKAIDCCIEQGLELSVEDDSGTTPLKLAYKSPNDYSAMRIAAKLILAGTPRAGGDFDYFEKAVSSHNPLYRFDDGQTPLHIATLSDHTGIVEYILKEPTTIPMASLLSAQDISGATPLHEAVRWGKVQTASALISAGANVDARDNLGNTPILLTMPNGVQNDLYQLLIRSRANVNQKDMFGDCVLHKATMNRTSTEILALLIDSGAQVNERNKQGVTPLALAIDNGVTEHIDFYAKHGADIYAEDMNGLTPISRAMKTDSFEILKSLISSKNVNTKDSGGNTPLHLAINENCSNEFLEYLIGEGADSNARNSSGDSVLFLATQKNRKTAGELLLANGADIFATNTKNNSPLRVALTNEKVQDWFINSETLLLRDGSGNSPLHYAAEWKYDKATKMLIERGSDVNAVNANGETAVFSAVKNNGASIIDILVKNGATVDSRDEKARDNLGNTPLHACVKWDATNAAKKLISYGVDVDAQNLSGRTALSETCRTGRKDMAVLLIDSGANVNATDTLGRTVLMDAVQGQNLDMVKLLLNNGANAGVQDMNGRSAYHDAAQTGKIEIINAIRDVGGNPLSRAANGDTPLSLVFGSDEQVIKAVLGTNTTIVDSDGNTPVHIAVEKHASQKILKMLLSSGYPVSQRNGKGVTALHIAVTENLRTLALILLENGADPFLATNDGQNPITQVFKTKNTYILDAIVKYNAKKTDAQGDSILHYAARSADEETAKHLVELALSKTQRNISGETPAQMAARWGRPEIAEILK